MKPFRFPLQVLQALREHKEQVALTCYAAALRAAEEAARRLEANQLELQACWAVSQKLLAAGSPASELGRVQSYHQFLQERRLELERARREAGQKVARTWQELRSAMRDRQALEKYHDKQRQAYDLLAQREAQKQLDEMAGRLIGLAET
jgi:flagellar export protein FliJ